MLYNHIKLSKYCSDYDDSYIVYEFPNKSSGTLGYGQFHKKFCNTIIHISHNWSKNLYCYLVNNILIKLFLIMVFILPNLHAFASNEIRIPIDINQSLNTDYSLGHAGLKYNSTNSFADNACVLKPEGGLLDKMLFQFGQNASSWQQVILPYAYKIFIILFALEFMWQLSVKKVFAGDLEKLWLFFFARVILGLFFEHYLINIDLYRGVIQFFANIGAKLSGKGVSIADNGNALFNGLSPSEIISYFSCLSGAIKDVTNNAGGVFSYITLKIIFALLLVILFMLLLVLSFVLIKVYFQTYCLLYGGFILTGFAGSSWTMSYWQRYFNAISAMAIKFFIISILMGTLVTQSQNWVALISSASIHGSIEDMAGAIITILGEVTMFTLIAYQLPEWAADKLSGEIKIKLNDSFSKMSTMLSGG